jgi:acrylyl-CoA reductase (NADPH)
VTWRAFVATRADGAVHTEVAELDDSELPVGEVLVSVEWSAVNYKDAMVTLPGNRVARRSPLVPGVDLAGRVLESADPHVAPGTKVVVHGYDLGVAQHGGFATKARVPGAWVVPLPEGLTTRRAAAIGTAGFTAVLSADRLRSAGVVPGDGRVLVTGATGGVGSMAIAALARRGYDVVASTGKAQEHDYLRRLGASALIGRNEIAEPGRVLSSERWAGAVDCVGGETLAAVLGSLRYAGAVAASGLVASATLETTVYPFIIRAVSLLGVDSVETPIATRRQVWATIEETLAPEAVDSTVAAEVGLDELRDALEDVLAARVRGRILVKPA